MIVQAAAERGRSAIVALLLRKGADVHAQGGFYGSALQAAASARAEDVTRTLLDAGADPNVQAGAFRDALRAAAVRQDQRIFDLLIQHGANIDLTVRQLCEDNAEADGIENLRLAEDIRDAWLQGQHSVLMGLVRRAARRISDRQMKERKAKDREKASQYEGMYGRLRKAVKFRMEEDIKEDINYYRQAAIPATWLNADVQILRFSGGFALRPW